MKNSVLIFILLFAFNSCKNDDDSNSNCEDPIGLITQIIGSNSVTIAWSGSETSWEIEYGVVGFELGTGTVTQTSQRQLLISGLTSNTQYEIHLRSNCGSDGFSDYIVLDFITLSGNLNCNTPSNLSLIGVTSNFINIAWSENGETAWQIEFGLSGFELGTGTVLSTSQNFFDITGLTPSTTYEIYVRANCGSDGFSGYTDALVVTTDP